MGTIAIDSALRAAWTRLGARGWPALVSAVAAVALVADPARWLAGTWRDPAYQSDGAFFALLVAGLIVASLRSGPAQPDARAAGLAWRLLLGTAAARVAGHLLAVNTVGAVALAVDVGAIGVALGVDRRPFALRPLALAALFALALPIEHLLQRLLGHPMQLVAAALAEVAIRPFDSALVREGVLLLHPEVALAVDLPCSGARGLLLFSGVALACWCRRSATPRTAAAGCAAVLLGALAANALRVIALYAGARGGYGLLDEPWHSAIGAGVLTVGVLPMFAVVSRWRPREARWQQSYGVTRHESGRTLIPDWAVALLLCTAMASVLAIPEKPLDVSRALAAAGLPRMLGDRSGHAVPVSDLERNYFERYGGSVAKRAYRDPLGSTHTALVVRTAAPLRHLHGPDRCLIGAGHRVTRLGVRYGAVPTVVYRSVAPDGEVFRVEASYVDSAGRAAGSVSEVLWRWLEEPHAWSLVERISPFAVCEADPARCSDFDAALFAALDLPPPASTQENKP